MHRLLDLLKPLQRLEGSEKYHWGLKTVSEIVLNGQIMPCFL